MLIFLKKKLKLEQIFNSFILISWYIFIILYISMQVLIISPATNMNNAKDRS